MPSFTKARSFHFKNRLLGVRLLHDNALSHKSAIVREYLKQEKAVELPHPPYSPDLVPCDIFLFKRLKKTPCWKKILKAKKISVRLFSSILRKDYENALKNWIKRLKLCISYGGEYFEGLR
jgi:histone-lysine N-methyltransferase SETMAR